MTDHKSHSDSSNFSPDADWEALARHFSGESSPEESARIEAMLAERPEDRDILATIDRAVSTVAGPVADLDIEAALNSVKLRRDQAPSRPLELHRPGKQTPARTRTLWRVAIPALAAAVLFGIGVRSWMQDNNLIKQPVTPHRMLATGVGVRDSMQLSDGSRVILGPLSSVTLAAGYGETSREVEVKGEAWFDVVHDNAKPFTVRAGRATIVDVGTRFAVRSDTPEGVSVSVTQGSVSMRAVNTPAQSGVILQAGDNGLLKSGGEVVARRGVVNDDDVAWLSGRLVFREAALDEVKASMRRWYGLEVEFADPSLAGRHITASFNGDSPERVLDVLRLVLGADIERHGDTVVVRAARGSVR
jgi:transmembrane sensor